MKLGGPWDLTDLVRSEGLMVGPTSIWITGGAIKWGTANLDQHYATCKAAGVTPLVEFWFWGDDIRPGVITSGVMDQYQGTWKTRAEALKLARTIGEKATLAGVSPIVVIEHEFGKNKMELAPNHVEFASYFDDVHAAIKAACPSARTVFCSAIWNDQTIVNRNFALQIVKADIIGLQTLLFATRHSTESFRNAGPNLARAFGILRGTSNKPIAITDLGFSSYGGAFSQVKPFPGGDGRANEALQVEAFQSIVNALPAMGLEFTVYRALRDDPNFNTANYGGIAERYMGLVRADGTSKPALASALALAGPDLPAQLQASRTALAASQQALAVATAEVARLQAVTTASQATLAAANQEIAEMSEQNIALATKLAKIRAITGP